jgi:hypothetical protein
MLSYIAKNIEDPDELKYARAIINPFSDEARGCRIPSLAPDETITTYDYQTLSFNIETNGIMVLNYDAWGVSPYVLITDANLRGF